jgi:hypothetical protein
MIPAIIPQIILNKAIVASLNTPCTSRQRPRPDMYPPAFGGIDYCPTPCAALGIDDLNLICICVRCGEFHGAAYAGTAVSTWFAVWVAGGGASDEAGECSMYDGVAYKVVGARLETSVSDIGLAIEHELLGKIIAGFVGGICDGEWECNITEARTGDVGYAP